MPVSTNHTLDKKTNKHPQSDLFLARIGVTIDHQVWLLGEPVFKSLSGHLGVDSTEKPGRKRLSLADHRCFRRALYMAKPRTAHTVAPRLARSQKVEFFRSAWAMCLQGEHQGNCFSGRPQRQWQDKFGQISLKTSSISTANDESWYPGVGNRITCFAVVFDRQV